MEVQGVQWQREAIVSEAPSPCPSWEAMTHDPALLYPSQGPVGVSVTYGGDPIPKSPFSVAVSPSLDLSKIKVSGLGESK